MATDIVKVGGHAFQPRNKWIYILWNHLSIEPYLIPSFACPYSPAKSLHDWILVLSPGDMGISGALLCQHLNTCD